MIVEPHDLRELLLNVDAELLDPPTQVPGSRLYAVADLRSVSLLRAACLLFLS